MREGELKRDHPFFLASASVHAGVPGFWATDLSNELRTPGNTCYANYWIGKEIPEILKIIASPAVSFDVGLDNRGVRRVTVSRGDIPQDDPDANSAIAKMIQRRFFIYASNQVSPVDLPLFLRPSPDRDGSPVHIVVRPVARHYWDSPDIRLGIAQMRCMFDESNQRAINRIARKYGSDAIAAFKPPDPTSEWERIARATPLHAGLFLPVSFETNGSVVDAVLRLDSAPNSHEAHGTLFCDQSAESLETGTKLSRYAFFNHASHSEEAIDVIGIVARRA